MGLSLLLRFLIKQREIRNLSITLRFILVKIGILKKMVNSSTIILSLEEKNGSSQET